MTYFPLFFDLKGKKVLAVGAGAVAGRRIQKLCEFEAEITVVAPSAGELVQKLERDGRIRFLSGTYEEYRETLLREEYFLLFTATGNKKTDELAEKDGREKGIFVNVAGDRRHSDFYFPGIAQAGRMTAGVISGGEAHQLTGELTKKMQQWLEEKERDEA